MQNYTFITYNTYKQAICKDYLTGNRSDRNFSSDTDLRELIQDLKVVKSVTMTFFLLNNTFYYTVSYNK